MSIQAINLVKARTFGSASRKAVAMVLADYCDADWSCFVGQARLAFEADAGERTVRRILSEFEARGLIRRDPRWSQGHRTSDRTFLIPEAIAALPTKPSHPDDFIPAISAGMEFHSGHPRQFIAATMAGEPSVEPPDLTPLRIEDSREGADALFEVEPKVKPRPSRKTDPVFEAVLDVCNIDAGKTTDTSWALIGKVVRELKAVGAEPHEVLVKATTYRKMFPGAVLTPSALQKHWGSLQPEAVPASTSRPEPGRGHVPDPRYPYRRV